MYKKFLSYIPENCSHIISGGAQGVDFIAEIAANYLNLEITIIRPDYKIFGKTAPLVRNRTIVNQSDFVVAFWDMKSRGTAHVLKICRETQTPYKIVDLKNIK